MNTSGILHLCLCLAITCTVSCFGNSTDTLSASSILDKVLEQSGGVEHIAAIHTAEYAYKVTTPDSQTISIIAKKIPLQNLLISTLSDSLYSSATVLNQGRICIVNGGQARIIHDSMEIDGVELSSHVLAEYAYRSAGYTLERKEDQKFTNFDCYTVVATSKNGYQTVNYIDKKTFRLIMIIYPSGRKTIFTAHTMRDSILVPTNIIHVDEKNRTTFSQLQDLHHNRELEPEWFMLHDSLVIVPYRLRIGSYQDKHYPDNLTERSDNYQTDLMRDSSSIIVSGVQWLNGSEYRVEAIRIKPDSSPIQKGETFHVKIIGWNKQKYVCHYFSKRGSGTKVCLKTDGD